MKFGIGLESLMGYDTHFDANNEPGITGVEALLEDNLFDVESGEYKSAIESLDIDINVLLSQGTMYEFGTEADDPKKEENKEEGKTDAKKEAWYKRLWAAIIRMFKAIGGWFTSAWEWVKKKFGKGGANDVAEVAKKTVEVKAELTEAVVKEAVKKNGLSEDEVKEILSNYIGELKDKKEYEAISGFIAKIKDEVFEEIVSKSQILNTPTNGSIEFRYYTFAPEVLGRIEKLRTNLKNVGELASRAEALSKEDNTHNVQAPLRIGAKLTAEVVLTIGSLLHVLFGLEIKNEDSFQGLLNTNKDMTLDEYSNIHQSVTTISNDVKSLAASKPVIKMQEHKIKFTVKNGVLDKSSYNAFAKSSEMTKSSDLSNHIANLADSCKNYMKSVTKVIATLENLNFLKKGDPGANNDTRVHQNLKGILTSVKTIGFNGINLIRQQTMAKIISNAAQA
jgi:hypothetical protein|nr:MAG TPA: hypothetical protein [Caudoviricetes sp.]